jgi:hypothetical protein
MLLYNCNKEKELIKMSKEFSEKTMLEVINQYLDDGYTNLESIQNEVNNDYWIIGTYKASQALEAFDSDDELAYGTTLDGIFGAIQYVQAFEEELGEQLSGDKIEPENISNIVAFVNMQYTINDILNHFDYDFDADDELTDKQIQAIRNLTVDDLQD